MVGHFGSATRWTPTLEEFMSHQMRSAEEAPVPTRKGGGGRPTRYPWPELYEAGVGASFVMEAEDGEDVTKMAASAQSTGYNWLRRQEYDHLSVTVRANEDEGTIAVWLVEKTRRSPASDLPEDMPGRADLLEAQITTLEAVGELEDLTSVPGIGPKTAEQIQGFLAAHTA